MPEHAGWCFDCVTLSNFALAGGLEVLTRRYRDRALVATQVVDELTRGVAAGHAALAGCLDLVDKGLLRVVSLERAERDTYRELSAHLGAGEAGTIAVARHRHAVAVTDDLAARRTCAGLNVAVTGTIGILQAAVRDGDLTPAAANELLRKMLEFGFHSPVGRIT